MTTLNTELIQISKLNVAVQADFKGLTEFVAGLEGDAFTQECHEVVRRYEQLTISLTAIADVIA